VSRIIRWIESPPPEVAPEEACRLAERYFGIRPVARELYAERDRNFRLDTEDGRRYLLKISNGDADPDGVAFQVRALRHIAASDPGLPVPAPVPDRSGGYITRWRRGTGAVHLVRLSRWLDGACIEFASAKERVRRETGRCLARLGQALAGCDPAGAPRELPWDLRNTLRFRDLTAFIRDPATRTLVQDRFERFERELHPAFEGLRRQVIHNDFNPGNILFSRDDGQRITGIIDFGDMIDAPLVFDLAVAGAYQLSGATDPVGELAPLVSGYHSVTPLGPDEFELLLPLIECRLMATYLIQGTRAVEHPDSDEDLAGSSERAHARLHRLAEVPRAAGAAALAAACARAAGVRTA